MGDVLKGKIVFVNKDGLFGIKTDNKTMYLAWKHETDAKIKTGKSVLFERGEQDIRFADGKLAKRRHALNVRNNTLPPEFQDELLKEIVREYYDYEGVRRIHLFSVITNKVGRRRLVVHFMDVDGIKFSSLLDYMKCVDGHYELFEADRIERKDEQKMMDAFENSRE